MHFYYITSVRFCRYFAECLWLEETLNNHDNSEEWQQYRTKRIHELYELYKDADVHADPVLEGFNILHDNTGVKRRKNIPASENLIKLLVKRGEVFYINQAVDIYNLISLDSKLALGAHNIDKTDGGVTLRFTDGTEKYIPIGQNEPTPVAAHEYCYCDDSNEVLCRLEIRHIGMTKLMTCTKKPEISGFFATQISKKLLRFS